MTTLIHGGAHLLGDDINTDIHCSSKYDEMELDLAAGRVAVPARGLARDVPPLPAEVQAILAAGGLIPFLKVHPDWKLEPAPSDRR